MQADLLGSIEEGKENVVRLGQKALSHKHLQRNKPPKDRRSLLGVQLQNF